MIYKREFHDPYINSGYITAQTNLIFRARLLWRDLATWLRAYLVSLYGGLGDTDAISRRLYELATDYGDILKIFFGDSPTQQLIRAG